MEGPLEESRSVRSNRESSSDCCDNFCPLQLNSSQANLPSELPREPKSVSFYVGQQFSKFKDLEQHLKLYEEQQFIKFRRRDSRTIEVAQKRVNKPIKNQLKYYQITYCCIHGGKKFKARGEGIVSLIFICLPCYIFTNCIIYYIVRFRKIAMLN